MTWKRGSTSPLVAMRGSGLVVLSLSSSDFDPECRFAASQRYVWSWGRSRHDTDMAQSAAARLEGRVICDKKTRCRVFARLEGGFRPPEPHRDCHGEELARYYRRSNATVETSGANGRAIFPLRPAASGRGVLRHRLDGAGAHRATRRCRVSADGVAGQWRAARSGGKRAVASRALAFGMDEVACVTTRICFGSVSTTSSSPTSCAMASPQPSSRGSPSKSATTTRR